MTIGEAEAQVGMPFIIGIKNGDEVKLEPAMDEMIWAGSVCAFMGDEEDMRSFKRKYRLEFRSDLNSFVNVLSPNRAGVSIVVIPPGSRIVGKTIVEIGMRKRYGTSVLAIYRGEEVIRRRVRDVKLHAGDTLALHSSWTDLDRMSRNRDFVIVTDYPRQEIVRPNKLTTALAIFVVALSMIVLTSLPLALCLWTGALLMVINGVLTIDEAYRSVGWQTVFLLGGLIPLAIAMQSSGAAAWLSQQILSGLGDVPIWVLQTVLAIVTTVVTLLTSNVWASVVLIPIAVNLAVRVGADPAVFALTVALATSNSFLIPTHQVNALIKGPANYGVADFLRAGGVMTILFLVVMLVMLNVVF